jgi:hypothetical protein
MVHAKGNDGAFTDDATEGVELDFPGWRVWRSRDHTGRPGSWWASRRHSAAWAEPQTVAGETEAELRAGLDSSDVPAAPEL